MQIYLLMAAGGSYDDNYSRVITAFTSEKQAKDTAAHLNDIKEAAQAAYRIEDSKCFEMIRTDPSLTKEENLARQEKNAAEWYAQRDAMRARFDETMYPDSFDNDEYLEYYVEVIELG